MQNVLTWVFGIAIVGGVIWWNLKGKREFEFRAKLAREEREAKQVADEMAWREKQEQKKNSRNSK